MVSYSVNYIPITPLTKINQNHVKFIYFFKISRFIRSYYASNPSHNTDAGLSPLIVCKGSFDNFELNKHWWGTTMMKDNSTSFFKHIFKNYNLKDKENLPDFETVDNSENKFNNATYKEDVFGDIFIDKHLNHSKNIHFTAL